MQEKWPVMLTCCFGVVIVDDEFTERSSSYNLHGNHILALSNPKTTTYGLHSFSYVASKM